MELKIYPHVIEIDGSRVDEDPLYRTNRIHMIVGYAQALADLDNNEEYYKKILSIYDHKGTLTITWETEPTEAEKGYLQKAWGSVVTAYEGNQIDHETAD